MLQRPSAVFMAEQAVGQQSVLRAQPVQNIHRAPRRHTCAAKRGMDLADAEHRHLDRRIGLRQQRQRICHVFQQHAPGRGGRPRNKGVVLHSGCSFHTVLLQSAAMPSRAQAARCICILSYLIQMRNGKNKKIPFSGTRPGSYKFLQKVHANRTFLAII